MELAGRSVVLTGVGREGQVGEVVARAFADRGARVFLVDRLEDEGLVQRVADPQDRRAIGARLTEQGASRHGDGVHALEVAERELLNRLKGPQRTMLLDVLRELRTA